LLELSSVAVRPRGNRHVALVEATLGSVGLLVVLGFSSFSFAVAIHPIHLGLVLLGGGLALLAVLRMIQEVVHVGRLVWLIMRTDSLLDDESPGVATVLPQSSVIHLTSGSAGVY